MARSQRVWKMYSKKKKKSTGFRGWHASSLGLLLQQDQLYIESDEQIWCYLMEWLDYMELHGSILSDETVDSLLKCVRFEHMDKNYMIQIVAQWPFWFKTVQRKELLVAALTTSDGKDKRFLSALGVEHFRPKRKLPYSHIMQFPIPANGSYARDPVFGLPLKFHINEDKDAELFYLIGSIDFSHPCLNYLNPKSNIKVRVKLLDLNIDDELLDGSTAPALFIYDGPCKKSDVPLCKFKLDKSFVLSPGDQMVYCMIFPS
eukprot:191260_1